MLKNLFQTLNNTKEMQNKFAFLSVWFVCLAAVLFLVGSAYSAGFAVVGCFMSAAAAAINATITSISSGAGTGDTTEDGSIG